jgi:hypothetical protein
LSPSLRDANGDLRLTPLRVTLGVFRRSRAILSEINLILRNKFSQRSLIGPSDTIVSLTSYGSRIDRVHLTIEAIGRGSTKPRQLILWLDDASAYARLNSHLERLVRRGLTVKLSENFGPHTKYLPYVLDSAGDPWNLVTADDDVLYPKYWLSKLIERARNGSSSTLYCYRAHRIHLVDDVIAPYNSWQYCSTTESSYAHFATGVSGILYPQSFQKIMRASGITGVNLAPTADDVWINALALRSGWTVTQVDAKPRDFDVLRGSQKIALRTTNVSGVANDIQILKCYDPASVRFLQDAIHNINLSSL